mmetsp:Transcript_29150/g.90129  ORF Transcript_29150/g.90129 Transcript_29150/m.90129 type:complete len:163 (-) Transcript_29150:691-1179(-)
MTVQTQRQAMNLVQRGDNLSDEVKQPRVVRLKLVVSEWERHSRVDIFQRALKSMKRAVDTLQVRSPTTPKVFVTTARELEAQENVPKVPMRLGVIDTSRQKPVSHQRVFFRHCMARVHLHGCFVARQFVFEHCATDRLARFNDAIAGINAFHFQRGPECLVE